MSRLSRSLLPAADNDTHDQFDIVHAAVEVLIMDVKRGDKRAPAASELRTVDPMTAINAALTAILAEYGARCDIGSVAKSYIAYTNLQVLFGGLVDNEFMPDGDEAQSYLQDTLSALLDQLARYLDAQTSRGESPNALSFLQQEIRHLSL